MSKSSAILILPKAQSSSAPGSESDAGDTEFEPTAEMMMDEYDDERTLDEAEAEAANEGEDQEEEISNLQKVEELVYVLINRVLIEDSNSRQLHSAFL